MTARLHNASDVPRIVRETGHHPPRAMSGSSSVIDMFHSSKETALQKLARDILNRPPGSRLATTVEYQTAFEVGSGTIQKALGILESSGAVSLRKRGHQGTHVLARDFGLLWNIARLGELRVVLAPPGPIDGFGLAKGIRAELDRLAVPTNVLHASGAARRVEMIVEDAADLVVISEGAADNLSSDHRNQLEFFVIGADSYYCPGSLVVLRPVNSRPRTRARRPLRVGLDRGSHDHMMLTKAEYPKRDGVAYVPCDYLQIPSAILEDRIDCGVWHKMHLLISLELIGIATTPLSSPDARRVRDRLAGAVMVIRSGRPELSSLVSEIKPRSIIETQRRLLALPSDSEEFRLAVWSS